jgi:hypothetical protein
LVLIGGLSAGTLASCGPSGNRTPSTNASDVYTNNHYLPGVGYYHAPFRAWYALPYNHYDPQSRRYFQGGQWAATPYASITNVSGPTALAAQRAQGQRTDIRRSGFGSTSGHHYIHS